jgi:Tol biopolymer transport system component
MMLRSSGFIRAAACGAAALLAAAFMASCSDTSTEPGPVVEKTLKIAFISARDGNAEIYVMNADGTNQKRLTHNDGADGPFCWSPDGSRICYVSEQPGFVGIYVMNADGTNQRLLTQIRDNEETNPAWSSNGRRIAFSAYADGSYEIEVINADGTNLTNLTHSPGNDFDPTWSPDCSHIAFVTEDSLLDGSLKRAVCIMNADGTGIDTSSSVTCYPPINDGCTTFRRTVWSPVDNAVDAVAYVESWEVPPYSGICRAYYGPLTFSLDHRDFDPVWSPDGSKLAFVSNRDGTNEIYVMESDGSNQTRATFSGGGVFGAMWPAWTPDGSKIVYASDQTGNYEIYIKDFTPKRLTDNTAVDMSPSCAMSQY